MMHIDTVFQSVIPPLSDEEYGQLEINILEDGCRNPLVLWGDTLVDGHNRYKICTKHSIPYETVQKEFADREDAIIWICKNQTGRRNLTPEQLSYLRGKQYETEKKRHGGDRKSSPQNEDLKGKTKNVVAEDHGVSASTIERDEKFSKAVDALAEISPEIKPTILSGKAGTKSDVIKAASATDDQRLEILSRVENGQSIRDAVREICAPMEETTSEPEETVLEPEKVVSIKEIITQLKSNDIPELTYTPEIFLQEIQGFAQQFLADVELYADDEQFLSVYGRLSNEQTEIVLETLEYMQDAIRGIRNTIKKRRKQNGA